MFLHSIFSKGKTYVPDLIWIIKINALMAQTGRE